MRTAARLVLLFTLALGLAHAQREVPYKGHGYVFFAPGVSSPGGTGLLHYGGGGEAVFFKGIGMGAEVGYIHPARYFREGFGLLSVNGLFQFGEARPYRKVVPFVTGGYSLGFRQSTANLYNFGGGATWWIRERMGLRFELRDHMLEREYHLVSFRVGLSFR